MWVLAVTAVILLALLYVLSAVDVGVHQAWAHLASSRWFWLYAVLCFVPVAVGVYYWFLLRNEETVVTDEYIERRSYWGTERVDWDETTGFYRQVLPFRQTRLGRISGLSRVLVGSQLIAKLPPYAYRIATDESGPADDLAALTIEPGTVDDLPWLIKLITERLGPPQIL